MVFHSEELRRCELLLACTAESVEAIQGLGEKQLDWCRPMLDSLAALLEESLSELAPMMSHAPNPTLPQRLLELAAIEDGLEIALMSQGWQIEEPTYDPPPVLTERLDDQT